MIMVITIFIIFQVFTVCYGEVKLNNQSDKGVVLQLTPAGTTEFDTTWFSNWEGRSVFMFESSNHNKYKLECYPYSFEDEKGLADVSNNIFRAKVISLREEVEIENFEVEGPCKLKGSAPTNIDSIQAGNGKDGEHVLKFMDRKGKCYKRKYKVTSQTLSAFVERFIVEDISCEDEILIAGENSITMKSWSDEGKWSVTEFLNDIKKSTPRLSMIKSSKCSKKECYIKCRKHTPPSQPEKDAFLVADVYMKTYHIERMRVATCKKFSVEASTGVYEIRSLIENNDKKEEFEFVMIYMNHRGKCIKRRYISMLRKKKGERNGKKEQFSLTKYKEGDEEDCPKKMKAMATLRKRMRIVRRAVKKQLSKQQESTPAP